MYLICTTTHRFYGKGIRVKVTSLWDALQKTKQWIASSGITKNVSIKRALVYVKGVPLVWCDGLANKVFEANPKTECKTEVLLLDGKDHALKLEQTNNQFLLIHAAKAKLIDARRKWWISVLEPLIGSCSMFPMIDATKAAIFLKSWKQEAYLSATSLNNTDNEVIFNFIISSKEGRLSSKCSCSVRIVEEAHVSNTDSGGSTLSHVSFLITLMYSLLFGDDIITTLTMIGSAQSLIETANVILMSEEVMQNQNLIQQIHRDLKILTDQND